MIAKPPHNRRLGVSSVSLTMQRLNKHGMRCLNENKDEIEKVLLESGFYENAPFWWITIVIKDGLKNDDEPKYGRISKKYGDLPLSIEVDIQGKRHSEYFEIFSIYRIAILKALIHAGRKYKCNIESLNHLLQLCLDSDLD